MKRGDLWEVSSVLSYEVAPPARPAEKASLGMRCLFQGLAAWRWPLGARHARSVLAGDVAIPCCRRLEKRGCLSRLHRGDIGGDVFGEDVFNLEPFEEALLEIAATLILSTTQAG